MAAPAADERCKQDTQERQKPKTINDMHTLFPTTGQRQQAGANPV